MIEIADARLRPMGGGLGIYVPKELIEKAHLKEDERVSVLIMRRVPREAVGFLKRRGINISDERILELEDETREIEADQ